MCDSRILNLHYFRKTCTGVTGVQTEFLHVDILVVYFTNLGNEHQTFLGNLHSM